MYLSRIRIKNFRNFSELDVQLAADGTLVVTHDPDLNRIAGVDRKVRELNHEALADAGVPTFREVLDQTGGRVPLLVDLK